MFHCNEAREGCKHLPTECHGSGRIKLVIAQFKLRFIFHKQLKEWENLNVSIAQPWQTANERETRV